MKPFVIDTKSWHYLLVCSTLNSFDRNNVKDFCSYARWVFGALVVNILVGFCLGGAGLLYLFFICRAVYLIYTHNVSSGLISVIVGVAFLLCPVVYFAVYKWFERRSRLAEERWRKMMKGEIEFVRSKPSKEPGFIAKAWESFHNKTCYRVEFDTSSERE